LKESSKEHHRLMLFFKKHQTFKNLCVSRSLCWQGFAGDKVKTFGQKGQNFWDLQVKAFGIGQNFWVFLKMHPTRWLERVFLGYPQFMVKPFGGTVKTFGACTFPFSRALRLLNVCQLARETVTGSMRIERLGVLRKGQNFWDQVRILHANVKRALGCFDLVIPHRPR
jgi:hypothetical protein